MYVAVKFNLKFGLVITINTLLIIMILKTIFVFFHFALHAAEIPDFNKLTEIKNQTFFLSTTRSGSNLVSASLSIITRKPISWIRWKNKIFEPLSEYRNHPSYNRLGLSLISDIPLLYRTHYDFAELMRISSKKNKLIFLTRNPKELLFRKFLLTSPPTENPDAKFIENFLNLYLKVFKIYDRWFAENKFLIFYEDFIAEGDEIILAVLQFMGEEPKYVDDFILNKQVYMSRLLESYQNQHKGNLGGLSSIGGAKTIFYSRNAELETLKYIDKYIEEREPNIWKRYLKRYQVSENP